MGRRPALRARRGSRLDFTWENVLEMRYVGMDFGSVHEADHWASVSTSSEM
jgi:hypothetical protein